MAEVKPVPKWALQALDRSMAGWYSKEDAAAAIVRESPFQEARDLAKMVIEEFPEYGDGSKGLVGKARTLLQKLKENTC